MIAAMPVPCRAQAESPRLAPKPTTSLPASTWPVRSGWVASTPVSSTATVTPAPLRGLPGLLRVQRAERPVQAAGGVRVRGRDRAGGHGERGAGRGEQTQSGAPGAGPGGRAGALTGAVAGWCRGAGAVAGEGPLRGGRGPGAAGGRHECFFAAGVGLIAASAAACARSSTAEASPVAS